MRSKVSDARAKRIRILLAEDHTLIREAIRNLLTGESTIEVIGEAETEKETLGQIASLKPDIVVIGANMSNVDSTELTRKIKKMSPSTGILLMGGDGDAASVVASLKAGATGYLVRNSRGEQLINALHCVRGGGFSLHPEIAEALLDCFDCVFARMMGDRAAATSEARKFLSQRELQVLNLVAQGRRNQEIASELNVSLRTVQAHVSSILTKTNTNSRLEAVLVSLCTGWLTLDQIRQGLRVLNCA